MRRHSTYEKVMVMLVTLVIVTIIGFFARAALSPSVSYEGRIEISASPSDVWPYLVDEDKRTSWQTGVRTVVNLMGGELMMGSRSIVIKKINGEQWEIEEEVIDYIDGQTIAVIHSAEQYVEDIVIFIEQKEGMVEISYRSHKVHNDLMKNVLAPWFAYKNKQALTISLVALKRHIEVSGS
ncbi:MAG: SRPBCC family protein [Sphingomonadales bacterium]|nr:SRPBCC family protein [Sphingomonadales bacterium]